MSSYKSYYNRRPRDEEPSGSLEGAAQPSATKTTSSSGIPLPSRRENSRTPTSFFARNKQNISTADASSIKAGLGDERPSGLPRGSSSLSSRSSESSSRVTPAAPRSFGFGSSTKAVTPTEKEKPRNVLRRKVPSIDQRTPTRSRTKSDASEADERPLKGFRGSMSLPGGYKDPYPDAVLGIALPPTSSIPTMLPRSNAELPRPIVPEFAGLTTNAAPKQNPPTPAISASVSSPSTRYSDSPGPWSPTSTPTSMSSYSPGIVQPTKIGSIRTRQPSPTRNRPPVTRRKGHDAQQQERLVEGGQGLPVLRESLTSSSSGSTVKVAEGIDKDITVKKHRKKLTPPPPSPPPRKSSMRFKSPKKDESTEQETDRPTVVQNPPELAHLKTTIISPTRQDFPPLRPSRDGTEDLDIRPSPVIQSNLSPLKVSGHHRRSSSESPLFDTQARRIPVPSQSISFQTMRPSRPPVPGPQDIPAGPKPSTTPTTAKSHRFGLFSKRSKTVPDVSAIDSDSKPPRKGPAAGTGHEGYGKYAQRGRKSSVGSASTRARSTSTSGSSQTVASYKSNAPQPEMDDFLRARLEPVIISGGDGRWRSGSESEGGSQSSASSQPSAQSATLSMGATRLWQLAAQDPDSQTHDRNAVNPEMNSNLLASSTKLQGATRTLADRRSLRRSQYSNELLRHPAPINTQLLASPPSLNSCDTSQSSLPQADTTLPPGEDLVKIDSRGSNKTEKTGRKLRWNFFQRSQASGKKKAAPEPEIPMVTEMPAAITRIPAMRPVAHYAMMDSEAEHSDTLEDLMHRVEDSPSKEEVELVENISLAPSLKRQHGQSVLLPSPPSLAGFSELRRPSSPKVQFQRGEPLPSPSRPQFERESEPQPSSPRAQFQRDIEQEQWADRPSRLPQIGRIPRVISKRDRQHKPAVQSFSRPFIRTDALTFAEGLREDRPILGIQTELLPSRPFHDFENDKPASAPAAEIQRVLDPLASDDAFLTFPPRKGSEVSGSSSSGVLSYAATTAVLPDPGSHPTEDEVWNEYDDLLDHVMSPITSKSLESATSSQGFPFQYTGTSRGSQGERTTRFSVGTRLSEGERNSRTSRSDRARDSRPPQVVTSPTSPTRMTSVVLPPSLPSARSSASVRLRRSRILSALHSSIAPSTPMSVSDLLAQYAEGQDDDIVQRQSSSSTGRASMRSSHTRNTSNTPVTAAGSDEINRQRNSVLMDMAERDREGPIAQSNLRFGALMTSRWLSFGRVLFSPAHSDIRNTRQDRILVLDGLGNDDWSFYCAETYPSATVYSLSQVAPPPFMRNRANPSILQSPPNHRTIHHPSIGAPFPFPKGFFTVAIFRFPSASSEPALRNAICECRRVLRPGGYIELSVLDIDMLNMGTKTRRAVRDLRVRMSVADPEVSLKPAGDNIQRMLGRRGFENLNRCMVSIPVAGKIGTSEAGSNSRSSMDVDIAQKNISLNEMLHDPSPAGDEGITKMVSRVGRWWFTRCYEWGVLPNDDLGRSIWADKAVIRECERMETGFRLLIAYAQKPDELVRRTVSV